MRFAYADPPYLGCCKRYDHRHPDGKCWDDLTTHAHLIERLTDDFPDGWVLSLHEPSLRHLLPLCPDDARVMPWCKTWHQIRPKVSVQYAWEPVIVRGGRQKVNDPMVRDWFSSSATTKRGTIGAKPDDFCFWVFSLLGLEDGDELIDLFPGSGAVSHARDRWQGRPAPTPQERLAL